jgi:hypothetical protein
VIVGRYFASILVFLLATSSLVFGQLEKLDSIDDFSPDAIKLHFGEIGYSDSPVGDAYAALGVLFDGEGSSSPKASKAFLDVDGTWWGGGRFAIRNERADGTSPNEALIMRFRYPMVRVGFDLGNGTETTVAQIRAFTAAGEQLGMVEQEDIEEEGPFVGVETIHPAGISTLSLDYGAADEGEQVSLFRMDFLSPQHFRTYLPQIAHGRTGDRLLRTTIQIQALAKSNLTLSFFDPTGQPMAFNFGGDETSTLEFSFPGIRSRRLRTEGSTDETQVGYAVIESNYPIEVQAIFQVTDQDSNLLSEAGISASLSQLTQFVPVEYLPEQKLDTAIAFVNTGDRETYINLSVLDEDGLRADWLRNTPYLLLAPGEHRALFISQICTAYPEFCVSEGFPKGEVFQGSVKLWTRGDPLAATALRTVGGIVISSVEVEGTRR